MESLRHEKLSPICPDILVAINNLHVGWRVRQLWKRRSIALQMTALGIHPKVDVRELGQQIGKAGEKPTVRERQRHLHSDDFQSGALLDARSEVTRVGRQGV